MNIKTLITTFIITTVLIFGLPISLLAGELGLQSEFQTVGIGQKFQIDLWLDTDNEPVNALEGQIIFPAELFKLEEIRDGASVVGLWVEAPHYIQLDNGDGKIIFSGIIPHGMSESRARILSVIVEALEAGSGSINVINANVIGNGISGRRTPLTLSRLTVNISADKAVTPFVLKEDKKSPEPFYPRIASGPDIFDNDFFVIFQTTDDETGIDHYEIIESSKDYSDQQLKELDASLWQMVINPARLSDQSLSSFIYIKAVDRAGNQTIAKLAPQATVLTSSPYKYYIFSVIIGVVTLLCLFFGFIMWRDLWKKKIQD